MKMWKNKTKQNKNTKQQHNQKIEAFFSKCLGQLHELNNHTILQQQLGLGKNNQKPFWTG